MNAVQAVLYEKQVPKSFWPEAVRWCVYVQNRNPTTTVVSHDTPEEIWSGIKPITFRYLDVLHMFIFWIKEDAN